MLTTWHACMRRGWFDGCRYVICCWLGCQALKSYPLTMTSFTAGLEMCSMCSQCYHLAANGSRSQKTRHMLLMSQRGP